MDIGAEGPEEISVSIVAQLLKVRNERKALSYTSLLSF
jgi:xanthine/CO dehydrogenase XdhC/CoxF family maturation factor